jgi:hypothetical protein
VAYRFAALCLLSRGAVCKSMYRICEKGILHNPSRLLCDFYRAATKGWPQNESRAILFSAPGISVSDPKTIPNPWKQKPALFGRSFPVTKVEFIRVITKQKNAISPPPGKKSIFQAFTTEKRICCVLICNPMGFLFYWLLSPLFRLTSLVLERSV